MPGAKIQRAPTLHIIHRASRRLPLQLRGPAINVVCDRSDDATHSEIRWSTWQRGAFFGAECAAESLGAYSRNWAHSGFGRCGAPRHCNSDGSGRGGLPDWTTGPQRQPSGESPAAVYRSSSLLIESDFDVQSDPRLATLYSRIMDGIIRTDQTASAQGLDLSANPQATPAPPAPLDVITSLTPPPEEGAGPVDPSLRTSAEGELQEVPHDLPLTVNDSVLSF